MHTRANDNYNLHNTENKSSPMPREGIREGGEKADEKPNFFQEVSGIKRKDKLLT